MLYFKWKLTLSKTTKWLSMSLVADQGGFFSVHLLGIVSGMLQPFLGSYGLFRVVPFFTSKDVTECFDLQIYYKSTLCIFYYKGLQAPLSSFVYFKLFICPSDIKRSKSFRGFTPWNPTKAPLWIHYGTYGTLRPSPVFYNIWNLNLSSKNGH